MPTAGLTGAGGGFGVTAFTIAAHQYVRVLRWPQVLTTGDVGSRRRETL